MLSHRFIPCFVLLLLLLFISQTAQAHFNLNINIRVFHVIHQEQQIQLLVRMPLAYIIADQLGEKQQDGTIVPAPYTINRIENQQLMHYLDKQALLANPQGLAMILKDHILFKHNDQRLLPTIGRVRAYPALEQTPFTSMREAQQALAGPIYDDNFAVTYAGDTIIDAEFFFPITSKIDHYELSLTLNPQLPTQQETANLILDHRGEKPRIFRIRGLMDEPVIFANSSLSSIQNFIQSGLIHILTGYDHVLFVLVLILGVVNIGALVWRITGFTIGHSVTLSLGFFGYVPKAAWFVPVVEIMIAASIIYVAILALIKHSKNHQHTTTLTTTLIGLLHGFGFSFILQEILNIDSEYVWQSLLSFNIGVELGQLMIVVLVYPLLRLIDHKLPQHTKTIRYVVAIPAIMIAVFWMGERTMGFIQ